MTNNERGTIGRELHQLHEQQEWIAGLQRSAEQILASRYDATPQQYGHHQWSALGRRGQNRVGGELTRMVKLAEDARAEPRVLVGAGLLASSCQHLTDAFGEYRESLPYSRAETRWLGGLYGRAEGKRSHRGDPPAMIEWIMEQGGEIISGGQCVEADGKELVDRGWDWMRAAGDFKRNSTYEVVTRNAVRRIANLFDRNTTARQLGALSDREL